MAKLIHYFKDTDMRNAHAGLMTICKKKGIKVENLRKGEFVLFVNKSQSVVKLLGPNGTIVHVKSAGHRLDLRTIQHIPDNFNGKGWSYKSALKKTVERDMAVRRGR